MHRVSKATADAVHHAAAAVQHAVGPHASAAAHHVQHAASIASHHAGNALRAIAHYGGNAAHAARDGTVAAAGAVQRTRRLRVARASPSDAPKIPENIACPASPSQA